MNIIKRLFKSQKGAALPLALILLGVGATLTIPVLSGVTNSMLVSRQSDLATSDGISANAGLEDTIWNLLNNDLENTEIPNEDDSFNYQLDDTINGSNVDITVTNKGTVVAADDFETDSWSGGTGWLSSWSATGMTSVINGEQPYQGTYHARIRATGGGIKRSADLTNQADLSLQFWARVKVFEDDDSVDLRVSSNGTDWTVIHTWGCDDDDDDPDDGCDDDDDGGGDDGDDGDDDDDADGCDGDDGDDDDGGGAYCFYNLDLSGYVMSSQYWIWFDGDLDNGGDKFFVDDLRIVHMPLFEVVIVTDDSTTTVLVIIDNGVASIYSLVTS